MRRSHLLLAVILAASACSKKPEETAKPLPVEGDKPQAKPSTSTSGETPGVASSNTPAAAKPASKEPVVRLLDAGKAPLAPLRFHAAKGTTQTATMVMKMGMQMTLGGGAPSPMTNLPAMKMPMDMTVTDVTKEGWVRYEFKVRGVDIVEDPAAPSPAATVKALRASLKSLDGMSGFGVVTDRGFVKEADVKIPEGAPANVTQMMGNMKQSLSQMVAPVPEEAVGEGATWEVTTVVSQGGLTLKQVSTYELLSRKGDAGKTKVTLAQSAEPQRIDAPGLPPGATVELLSLSSSGTGEQEFDLTKLVPVHATVKLSSAMEMSVSAGGKKQTQSMKMVMDMELVGKK